MKHFHFITSSYVAIFTIYKGLKPFTPFSFTITTFNSEFTRKQDFFQELTGTPRSLANVFWMLLYQHLEMLKVWLPKTLLGCWQQIFDKLF